MTDTTLPVPLPCPFCGNNKNIAVQNERHDHSGGYFISCPECMASTGLRFACGDDPRPLLLEQWNARACMAPLQERADALQAEVDSLRRAEKWGVKDLRERIWLDPECAEDGCQSLRFKARADALQTELNSIADTLPGVHYMDPPDGGAPTLVEQFKRMAKDAKRADALQAELAEVKGHYQRAGEHYVELEGRADALEAALKSALKHAKKNGMQGWPVFADMERLINHTGGES